MRFTARSVICLLALALILPTVPAAAGGGGPERDSARKWRVLVFSRTTGFRHRSIPAGVKAIQQLAEAYDFVADHSESPASFTDENLRLYAAVVFLNTTGDVLDETGQAALERFIRAGRGFVGIHAAADTEYEWPWYGELVGAYFKGHPRIQPARIVVADRVHPSTAHLPRVWTRTDEWYDYRASPRGRVHVLMALDEKSYEGATMGFDHPISWCHEFDGGRAWYTGGGHTDESYLEPNFLHHLLGGIRWAAGVVPGAAGATIDTHFDKVVLDDFVTDPMELAVAPDGRVIFVERGGVVKIWKPDLHATVIAGFLEVFDDLEDGLLGVALDPGFADNGWLYVFYSPAEGPPRNVLSRLTLRGDAFDPASEVLMLDVPTQRDECCHSGGSLTFGGDGLLYLSTGDNTSPFASDGYTPIDEREGRGPFDAQKSSADPFDLRGKILRIRPEPDGTYSIPPGNLFAPGGEAGRPEVYVMGCRNPFRISVDPETGWLFWGDVGPDASAPRAGRGPAGHDEFNVAREAGNFGWPYFIADNRPYHDHDFQTGVSGEVQDPAAPANDSPHAHRPSRLPPARPAWMWYPYDESAEFPDLGSGERCAMAGPVYHHDPAVQVEGKLPSYYDGSLFLYEWSRNWIMEVRLDDRGEMLGRYPFLPGLTLTRPIDLEIGPDGRLYAIEWGTGFGGGNPDAQIVRIDHVPSGRRPPLAVASASAVSGPVPHAVRFSAAGSRDRGGAAGDGGDLSFAWDLDGDRIADAHGMEVSHVYLEPGNHRAQLVVTDGRGGRSVANVAISAGNTHPEIAFEWPPDGGVCPFGQEVEYRIRVSDREDGEIDERRLEIRPALGHDTHAHPLLPLTGASGRFRTVRDEGHGQGADLFTVLAAWYTDGGGVSTLPLTARAEVVLQPRRKQAEHAGTHEGVRIEKTGEKDGGGQVVAFGSDGAWISFRPVSLHGIDAITVRAAAGLDGGTLELRLGAADGPALGSVALEPGGRIGLRAGAHPFRLEYFERTGGAGVILRIKGGGLVKQVVPEAWLAHGVAAGATGDETMGEGELRPAVPAAGARPGVEVSYYEAADATELPDFDALAPIGAGTVPSLDFPSTDGEFAGSGRREYVGAVFRGVLVVPESDHYALFLESDDGARLYLGETLIIDNDGLHGMQEKIAGLSWSEFTMPVTVPVTVPDPGGTHELFLVYRTGAGGDSELKLDWLQFEGQGVAADPGAPTTP